MDPVIWMVLVSVFLIIYCPAKYLEKWKSVLFVHTVCQAAIHGHLEGQHSGYANPVNFSSDVEPGDIILCHNQGGGYGYWTHCALYVGNNLAVDSEDFANGTRIVHVNKYRDYDRVAIYRGSVSEQVRQRIVSSALQEVGKPYDPFSSLSDMHSEYCSKFIWQVFSKNGVSICTPKPWIIPDDIVKSKNVYLLIQWDAIQKKDG